MAIAGCLCDRKSGEEETRRSLERLRLGRGDSADIRTTGRAILGATGSASLWSCEVFGREVAAAFDGVLYERSRLTHELEIPQTATDAELAGRAFLRWGHLFPDHLDGEYAFAVWDGSEDRLLLGKDAMGRGVLHYATSVSGEFCFASEPRGLLGWPGVDGSINEEMVARALTVQPAPGVTFYRGITSIPGAHTLQVFRDGTVKVERYWEPLNQPEFHAKDWRQYAEAIRAAMAIAVERRLPAGGLVGAQMSSGFDSSSVTALAAQALAKQNRPLVAYTSVPVHRTNAKEILENRFDNEWPLAAKVAAMYPNIEHVPIRTDGADWWQSLDLLSDYTGGAAGFIRNSRWFYGILDDARQRGLVTMLEGQAGNLTGSYDGSFGLYDLRKKGRWLQLARAVRNRRQHKEAWPGLVQKAWMPSPRAKARVQRLRGRKMKQFFELSLIRKDFLEQSGVPVPEFSAMGSVIEGDRSRGASWRLSIIEAGDMGMVHAMEMRAFGLRREDPTADRRLVELCLSMPDEAFAPNGVKRELYREGFRKDLPAELLAEPLRGLQSSDFLLMFEEWLPEWHAELERLEASASVGKYLDLPRMRTLLEDWPTLKAGPRALADQTYNYTFGGALALGRFIRRLEEHPAN